jgi:hypothetical protein
MLSYFVPSSPPFPIIAIQHHVPAAAGQQNRRNDARVSLGFEDVNKIGLKLLYLTEHSSDSRWR